MGQIVRPKRNGRSINPCGKEHNTMIEILNTIAGTYVLTFITAPVWLPIVLWVYEFIRFVKN